jgi:hypothetical protein
MTTLLLAKLACLSGYQVQITSFTMCPSFSCYHSTAGSKLGFGAAPGRSSAVAWTAYLIVVEWAAVLTRPPLGAWRSTLSSNFRGAVAKSLQGGNGSNGLRRAKVLRAKTLPDDQKTPLRKNETLHSEIVYSHGLPRHFWL